MVMLLLGGKRRGHSAFVSTGQITLFTGCALFTATVVGGSGYLIRELHRQVGVATSVVGVPNPIPEPSPAVEITSDLLHVSSIALGRAPIAVVNGVFVTEGATVKLQTPESTATLRVVKIRDGAVDFRYGGQTISALMGPPSTHVDHSR